MTKPPATAADSSPFMRDASGYKKLKPSHVYIRVVGPKGVKWVPSLRSTTTKRPLKCACSHKHRTAAAGGKAAAVKKAWKC